HNPVVPPTLPTNDSTTELKKIWATIQKLKAIIRQQAAQEAQAYPPPTPDPHIAILINQVAELRAELDKVCADRASRNPLPPSSEDNSCCTGL
ncbi:hypothetical protein DSO57_1006960, partial [Entomophthora muscae]